LTVKGATLSTNHQLLLVDWWCCTVPVSIIQSAGIDVPVTHNNASDYRPNRLL